MWKLFGALLVSALAMPVFSNDLSPVERAQPDRAYLLGGEEFLCTRTLDGQMFMRTELVFGMSRSNGPDITETEFRGFIDGVVTPKFPDGLTLLSGDGQFKSSTGTIVKEKSKLLVLLYPFSKKSSRLVEAIRDEYKTLFQQESVLRIDEESCVSF